MSQHDMIIDNAAGTSVRADLNLALQALASTSSGTAAPGTPYAGQMWWDTNTPSTSRWTLNVYDGTDWIEMGQLDVSANSFLPGLAGVAAAQADMEAATSTATVVTPARMKNHPGVGKVVGVANYSGGVPTLVLATNVGSVTDNGAGDITFIFTTPFSTVNYAHSISVEAGATGVPAQVFVPNGGKAADRIRVRVNDAAGAAYDPASICVTCLGDQ